MLFCLPFSFRWLCVCMCLRADVERVQDRAEALTANSGEAQKRKRGEQQHQRQTQKKLWGRAVDGKGEEEDGGAAKKVRVSPQGREGGGILQVSGHRYVHAIITTAAASPHTSALAMTTSPLCFRGPSPYHASLSR